MEKNDFEILIFEILEFYPDFTIVFFERRKYSLILTPLKKTMVKFKIFENPTFSIFSRFFFHIEKKYVFDFFYLYQSENSQRFQKSHLEMRAMSASPPKTQKSKFSASFRGFWYGVTWNYP